MMQTGLPSGKSASIGLSDHRSGVNAIWYRGNGMTKTENEGLRRPDGVWDPLKDSGTDKRKAEAVIGQGYN